MSLIQHAERELALLGDKNGEMQQRMNAGIIKIVKIFAEEGHSGFSASYAVSLLERLLRYEPLTPIMGTDDEWTEVSPGLFQNNRCSHLFKGGKDSGAYDIEGKIWQEPDGSCFTNFDSRTDVTFPYTPKRKYVRVGARKP